MRFVDVDDDGRIHLEFLERKQTGPTRPVAFSHVSNVIDYINSAAEICAGTRCDLESRPRCASGYLYTDSADIDALVATLNQRSGSKS